MELNREQIIKALECLSGNRDIECEKCYFYWHGGRERSCRYGVSEAALSLIKELTEENERFSQSLANSKLILANSKADTVRKMQDKLKAVAYFRVDATVKDRVFVASVDDINQVAKEMVDEI